MPREATASQRLARVLTNQAMALSQVTAVDVAQLTMAAVRESRFYVFTHPNELHNIRVRADDQLANRKPTDPFGSMPDVTTFFKKSLNSG
jgi:hypothetical protein